MLDSTITIQQTCKLRFSSKHSNEWATSLSLWGGYILSVVWAKWKILPDPLFSWLVPTLSGLQGFHWLWMGVTLCIEDSHSLGFVGMEAADLLLVSGKYIL